MEGFYKFCTYVVLTAIAIPIRGYVVLQGYDWFIKDQFQLPALNVWQVMGIYTLISLLTYHYHEEPKETKQRTMGEKFGIGLAISAFTLLFMWIYKALS